ncbi:MAG: F0F1 ATP synthase subunit A [Phycisphaeraceae bacterium]
MTSNSAMGNILAAANPIEHITDKPLWGGPEGWWISNYTIMLILGAILTAAIVIPAAKKIATGEHRESLDDFRAQGLWANLVESVCLYLRNEVFHPVLHEETDRYTPMLWTLFWFILICNLVGLVPILDVTGFFGLGRGGHGIGGTATQSIWVTGALATVAFLFWNGVAIKKDFRGWLKHLTAGAPVFMWPLMVFVELIGMFVKPVALALRLFANMTGGHIILAVLLSFVSSLILALGTVGYGLAIIPVLAAVAVYLLEILVAFIQAFVFTFLTTLFLGQLVAHGEEEEEAMPHAEPGGTDETKSVPLAEH